MRLIANSLNGAYPANLAEAAGHGNLTQIDLAVAYVGRMDGVLDLAQRTGVPLTLYALADGNGFPNLEVARRFVEGNRTTCRLYVIRDFFHARCPTGTNPAAPKRPSGWVRFRWPRGHFLVALTT